MNNWAQTVVVNDATSNWWPVKSDAPEDPVLGPVLFIILISDLDKRIKCSFSQFAGDTKLGRSFDLLKGGKALQRDLERLDRWDEASCMRFKKVKLSLDTTTLCCAIGWGRVALKLLIRKEPGSAGQQWLNKNEQEGQEGQEGQWHLTCIRISVASRTRAGIVPLYSVFERLHLESCVQLWAPQFSSLLEQV
ncbi:hypothetical protein TURU_049266 [Turdus rufiventris]|nr:hypothetical protein TURU_049266 [Turdus rufiventris]